MLEILERRKSGEIKRDPDISARRQNGYKNHISTIKKANVSEINVA